MPQCRADPATCRRDHIAAKLAGAEQDGTDWETRCPVCDHGGFRISRPTRNRTLRHIWTCNCKRCHCDGRDLRTRLIGLGVGLACLGDYDGTQLRNRSAPGRGTSAERLTQLERIERAALDILAWPGGLDMSDIRIILAGAIEGDIPGDHAEFVRFAMRSGLSKATANRKAGNW